MFYINVLCVAVICVLITDIFQFWNTFSSRLMFWFTKGRFQKPIQFKLFQCVLCQTHWISVITMFIMGCVTLPNYLYILLLAYSTNIIKNLLLIAEDKIINLINKLL